ncbi:MAG: DUF4864 domain-containing protein [Pseudomonadota bacterium]
MNLLIRFKRTVAAFTTACVIAAGATGPFAVLAMTAAPATADEMSGAEDIHAVIASQLERFNADDAAGAFSHASPNIQRMFRTPENFMSMVRRGYPQIARSKDARFLDLEMKDGALLQKVLVTGRDGRAVIAAYAMVEVDGVWRIDGCFLVKPPTSNA